MIKSIKLDDPGDQRPSNSQIKRLTVGDHISLIFDGEDFEVILLFIRHNDMVGTIKKTTGILLPQGLYEEDLINFETKDITRIVPDPTRMKLPPFMLLTHHENQDQFVLHTGYPRLIAVIRFSEKVEAKEAVWLDEPAEYDEEAPALLKKMTEWYFYNYLIKKRQ